MDAMSSNKRVRDDSDESFLGLPEVKRLREDLFDILDDSDTCTTSQDLDSFMKSFEKEISASSPAPVTVVDLTVDFSGDSQPDLGYLLEASDDELGLPPSISSPDKQADNELVRVTSDSSKLGQLWQFEEHGGYDSFDFGFGESVGYNNDVNKGDEYVAADGLFDYSDVGFDSSDFSWQPETLQALLKF